MNVKTFWDITNKIKKLNEGKMTKKHEKGYIYIYKEMFGYTYKV